MKRFSEIPLEQVFSKSDAPATYRCPICKDQGVLFDGEIAYPCRCAKEAHLTARKERAGITPRLLKQTFDRFDLSFYSDESRGANKLTFRDNAAETRKAARRFVDDVIDGKEPCGLMFQGAVGSGKTFLAAAIANALIEAGVDVDFTVVPDFLDRLRESFGDDSEESESDLMNEVKRVPVLILDDLGAHNYTDWSIKTIFAILNYRVNYEKPTIVTTNLERRDIEELLGSRIYSRLMEACRFFRLENTKDIRMEKRIREIRKG
ncbi:MAG: ATP-binding protein [Bacillota bacterium]|jgi:DNA replication protein DnaC